MGCEESGEASVDCNGMAGVSHPPIAPILDRLEQAYGAARWLNRFEPMEELVSCVLSQHTTDINSFPAFRNLRVTFADWADIEHAPAVAVEAAIRRAGMAATKAKHLQALLRQIRESFGGYHLEPLRTMPVDEARAWLQALPGVGPKTASIVLCFAFGQGAIPVDTHVYRVSWRLGWIPETLGEAKAHDVLLAQVAPEDAFRFHTALIQHGRKVCQAPLPRCSECVLTDQCAWYQGDGPSAQAQAMRAKRQAGRASKP